jgi:hypothetical protein
MVGVRDSAKNTQEGLNPNVIKKLSVLSKEMAEFGK